ncbi:MAG: carbohydrate ABC transporter permease [Armatimonadetes bacterium]|nr:carbohydrate ABC transporter permease [Armatimonadota bacterium]
MKGPTDQNDNRVIPAYWREDHELFRKFVDDKYGGGIETAGVFYGEPQAVRLMSSERTEELMEIAALSDDEFRRFERFLLDLPLDQWEPGFRLSPGRVNSKLSLMYQEWLRRRYAGIEALNDAYMEQNIIFQTVQPPAERYTSLRWEPEEDLKWSEWQEFKARLPAQYRVPITVRGQWQHFVRSRFSNRIGRVPEEFRRGADEFSSLDVAPGTPLHTEFLATALPERYRTDNPDARWKAETGEDTLPVAEFDAAFVAKHKQELRTEYSARNYVYVLDFIMLHGRAIWNSIIFCLLAVITQLTVNPIAAYALSRYPMPNTGKILLFLLATMAFPAEVTMIPAFLLLRDLGLLNTFAALVLPTVASGFSIYLLKGFFDSLPRDYYESGAIEGAKESTLFWKITIPLTKPVLAVIALTAFMGAYGAFIYAFLVAQDQRMWTLVVWIYELQTRAPKSVMMAALTLASVPTLLVFLAAQRVILRGIILPSEK